MCLREFLELRRVKKLFPKEKRNYWYSGDFHEYQHQLHDQGKPWKSDELELPCETFLVNPFKNHSQIRRGTILPCIRIDGYVGYYEITKSEGPGPWADLLPWDDGCHIDLRFHHCEREK